MSSLESVLQDVLGLDFLTVRVFYEDDVWNISPGAGSDELTGTTDLASALAAADTYMDTTKRITDWHSDPLGDGLNAKAAFVHPKS